MSHVSCHVSGVTCQVSHVRYHISGVMCHFFYTRMELVGGGSGINGAYPVWFLISLYLCCKDHLSFCGFKSTTYSCFEDHPLFCGFKRPVYSHCKHRASACPGYGTHTLHWHQTQNKPKHIVSFKSFIESVVPH